jgi:hypothetical protein
MKTKLVLFDSGNILVLDEMPKETQWCLTPANTIDIFGHDMSAVFTKEEFFDCKKLIASDNPKHNLPKIDYNGFEKTFGIKTFGIKTFGIIDLKNLCYYDKRNPDGINNSEDIKSNKNLFLKSSKKLDYKKCCNCDNCFYGRTALTEQLILINESNKEKFSLSELESLIEKYKYGTFFEGGIAVSYNILKDFIKSSRQPKSFDIEIELSKLYWPANMPAEGEERPAYGPKIIEGYIKILKVL